MRRSRLRGAIDGCALVALVTIGVTSAAAAQPRVSVYFLQGEQFARTDRPGATRLGAVRQLIAEPTRAEVRLGLRTYMRAGTHALSVNVANGTPPDPAVKRLQQRVIELGYLLRGGRRDPLLSLIHATPLNASDPLR